MKRDELEAKGLTQEQIEYVIAENGKDVQKEQAKTSAAIKERDDLKEQLDVVEEKLKAFDGIDVSTLQGEIKTLSDDLANERVPLLALL